MEKLINFATILDSKYEKLLNEIMDYLIELGIPKERVAYVLSMGNDYLEIFPFKDFDRNSGEQVVITIGADVEFNVMFDTSFGKEEDFLSKTLSKKSYMSEIKDFVRQSINEIIAARKDKYDFVIGIK